jgi:RNA polymerase sigma-70 factor (ECF subfamily)
MKRPEINLSILNDEELAQLAKMGKQDAFAALYERFLPSVYARVRFKIPEADVEDVTQEIFIAVLKSLHSFRAQSKFGTWVRTITNRKIVDYHRTKSVTQVEHQDYENLPGNEHHTQAEFSSQQDDLASIQHALLKLPQNYQDIILMRFVDDMPFSEIARHNGQSIEATKSLFRRSIAALSEKMQEEVLAND